MPALLVILTLTAMMLFIVTPNLILTLVTWNRANEDDHIAFGAMAFIPWTIFGLYLVS